MSYDRTERFQEWRQNRRLRALIARKKALYKKDFEKFQLAAKVLGKHFGTENLTTEINTLKKLWSAYASSTGNNLSNEKARNAALKYTTALLYRMEKKSAAKKLLKYFEIEEFYPEQLIVVNGKNVKVNTTVRVYENHPDQIGNTVDLKMSFDTFRFSFERYTLEERVELFQEIIWQGNSHPYHAHLLRAFVNQNHNPDALLQILTNSNYDQAYNTFFLPSFIAQYADHKGMRDVPLTSQELEFFSHLFFNNPRIFSVDEITDAIKKLHQNSRPHIATSLLKFFQSQVENEHLSLDNKFFCLDVVSNFSKPLAVSSANQKYIEWVKSQAEIAFHQSFPEENFQRSYNSFVKDPNKFLPLREYRDLSSEDLSDKTVEQKYNFLSSMYKLLCIPSSSLPPAASFSDAHTINTCCQAIRVQVQHISVLLSTLKLTEISAPKKQAAFEAALQNEIERHALGELALLPNDPYGARKFLEEKANPGFFASAFRRIFWWTPSAKKDIALTQFAQTAIKATSINIPSLVRQELPPSEEEMPFESNVPDYSNWQLAVIPKPNISNTAPIVPISASLKLPGLIPPDQALAILREHADEIRSMIDNIQAEKKPAPPEVVREVVTQDSFAKVLKQLQERHAQEEKAQLRSSGEMESPRSEELETELAKLHTPPPGSPETTRIEVVSSTKKVETASRESTPSTANIDKKHADQRELANPETKRTLVFNK